MKSGTLWSSATQFYTTLTVRLHYVAWFSRMLVGRHTHLNLLFIGVTSNSCYIKWFHRTSMLADESLRSSVLVQSPSGWRHDISIVTLYAYHSWLHMESGSEDRMDAWHTQFLHYVPVIRDFTRKTVLRISPPLTATAFTNCNIRNNDGTIIGPTSVGQRRSEEYVDTSRGTCRSKRDL